MRVMIPLRRPQLAPRLLRLITAGLGVPLAERPRFDGVPGLPLDRQDGVDRGGGPAADHLREPSLLQQ